MPTFPELRDARIMAVIVVWIALAATLAGASLLGSSASVETGWGKSRPHAFPGASLSR